MRKRILALLLAGVMIFNGESITAFAAEHDSGSVIETSAEEEAESTVPSGELQQNDEEEESAAETETVVETQTSAESRRLPQFVCL